MLIVQRTLHARSAACKIHGHDIPSRHPADRILSSLQRMSAYAYTFTGLSAHWSALQLRTLKARCKSAVASKPECHESMTREI